MSVYFCVCEFKGVYTNVGVPNPSYTAARFNLSLIALPRPVSGIGSAKMASTSD